MQLIRTEQRRPLTPRQLQLLKVAADFKDNRCYCPTIGELAFEMGISRSTAFEHIGELRKKGLLTSLPGKARSLQLTCKAQELLNRLAENVTNVGVSSSSGIPLAGTVAAGFPIEAVEQKETLSLPALFADRGDVFALEVKGDSMTDDGICDGDYVICRKSPSADNGQLVVAIISDENATLKRFYKEKSCVRLQPANDSYEPIYSDKCRIEAVVIGMIRKF